MSGVVSIRIAYQIQDRELPEQSGSLSFGIYQHIAGTSLQPLLCMSQVQLMPQTPTSRPKFAFLGSLRLPRPDLGMIGEVCLS